MTEGRRPHGFEGAFGLPTGRSYIACQQGDPRAFRQVYNIYKDRVYGLCRNVSGNDDDAADLTQEVFVSAFKTSGPSAWSLHSGPRSTGSP